MPLSLDLGAVSDPDVRRALERISAEWPASPLATTTAGRPPANRVAAGTMVFDVTLGRPVWSDGASWRGADGVVA
jgi:hypothetical protein